MNSLAFVASLILGALWRRVDGSSSAPNMWHLMPLPFIIASYWLEPMMPVALSIAWLSLLDGFRGWENFGYMSMRYTGYAALISALTPVNNWFILCGFFAGICYPTGAWLKTKGYNFKYTEKCEYIAGGLMFGGPVYFI